MLLGYIPDRVATRRILCRSGYESHVRIILGLRKFIEKFYIEKKKVNLGLELGAPDYQSDCSTTQATVLHTDHS